MRVLNGCVYVCECLPAVLSLMWLDEPDGGGGDKMCTCVRYATCSVSVAMVLSRAVTSSVNSLWCFSFRRSLDVRVIITYRHEEGK